MATRFDFMRALVEAHAHGDGGWRLYLAICAITDYLSEVSDAEALDPDGDAVADILEQCLVNKEEDSAVTVIHFTAGEDEDGEIQVNVKRNETGVKGMPALSEEEIKRFEEMMGTFPTAEKDEDNNDSSNGE